MNEFEQQEFAADDALRMHVSRLRDDVLALRETIDGIADLDTLATTCDSAWQEIKTIDLVLHEILVHDRPAGDPLAPHPTDGVLACITGALSQVVGTMSDEYEIDVAKKRLHMASALAGHATEVLGDHIDEMIAAKTDLQRGIAPEHRTW